jgi:hypothetical protein
MHSVLAGCDMWHTEGRLGIHTERKKPRRRLERKVCLRFRLQDMLKYLLFLSDLVIIGRVVKLLLL